MKEEKPDEKDDDLERINAGLYHLSSCRRRRLLLYLYWLLLEEWVEDIPMRWLEWQVSKEE